MRGIPIYCYAVFVLLMWGWVVLGLIFFFTVLGSRLCGPYVKE